MKKYDFKTLLPLISIFVIFMIDFAFIISTHMNWDKSMNKYIPLNNHIAKLESDLAHGHLWLHEAIGGDKSIDIEKDVMTPLRHEEFHKYVEGAGNILNGKNDEVFLKQLYELDTLLDPFYKLAQIKWANKSGTKFDQEFDAKFNEINNLLDSISSSVNMKLSNELKERARDFNIILTLFFFINIVVFTRLFISIKKAKEREEALFEANEKAIVTLKSIGDAVITTDMDGNITFMNPIAEKLTEYTNKDVSGLHVDTVLNLTNMKSGEKIATPIYDVLHNNLTKFISNGTKLISKSGIEYIISDSAAPIKNEDGKIIGTVLIFQDDTQDYKIQEELHAMHEKNLKLNDRMELALIGNSDGIWDWKLEDNSVYFSPLWKEMIGYSDDELPNEFSTWESRVHPDDLQGVLTEIQRNINKETKEYIAPHRLKHKNGHWVWILSRAKTQFDEDGKAIRVIGTHTDISKQKEIEIELDYEYSLIQKILDTVPIRIFWKDRDCNYLGANKLFLSDANMESSQELIGKNDFELPWAETDAKSYRDDDVKIMETLEPRLNYEEIQRTPNREDMALLTSKVPFLDHNGEIIGLLGTYTDITYKKKIEENLEEQKTFLHHQANHDALTGLSNRILFNDRLEQAIKKAKRAANKIALYFIDLDNFKEINDSLGHAVGDEILKVTSQRLKNTARKRDSIARLGGDEFTIIVEGLDQGEDASLLAQKILEALAEPIEIDGNTLYVSTSIGISLYPDDGTSAQNLLKYADTAMYKAKYEGKNNFQFYSCEMTELAFERITMVASMREALEHEDFIVYYQPQVDGKTNRLIGMEALVRWKHNTMGLVPPSKFIPLAESTGLIVKLDRWVMRTAMTQMVKWYNDGLNPGILALNLSIKQLKKKDFLTTLQTMMEETRCKPEWLELEVTEGQIMTNPQEAIKVLNEICNLSIELAVDDFGTGYSSLSYLKKLPINKLKIDQSFVRNLPDDEEDAAIAKSIIALASSLKLRIIAEGVEKEEQKEFLINHGCNNIQGYLYSRPIPANGLEKLLRNGF